jgi:hypothetical protein
MYHPLVTTDLSPCAVCGHEFCGDCLADFQGRRMCAPCKNETVARMEMGQAAAPSGAGEKAPWEERERLGVVNAFVQTVKQAMFSPGAFFERLDKTVVTHECLIVPIVIQTLAGVSTWLFQIAFVSAISTASPRATPFTAGFIAGFGLGGVILAPILAVLVMYVCAGCAHLVLVMMKKAVLPFHQTMRGYCYANSPNIVGVIPVVGPYVGFVWVIVANIIMVMKMHRTSGGVAALAVLAFPVLALCCVGAVGAAVAAMVVANRH